MSVPAGVAMPDTASSMDVASYQSQIDLHCKNIHGEEQRFAHGDVAAWRVSAVDMMPAPHIAEFDYGFTGWKVDVAAVAAGPLTITALDGTTTTGDPVTFTGTGLQSI